MKLHERLRAVFECRLDSSARMILTVIATASDEDDRPVWHGADTIAARAGLSRSTTIDLLRRLTIAGVLIEGERVQGASVRRHIDWHRLAALESLPTRPKSGRVQSSDGSEIRTGPDSGRVQSSDGEGSNPRTRGVQISDPGGPILGRGESEFRTRSVIDPIIYPLRDPSDDPSDERARPDPTGGSDARQPQPTPTDQPSPSADCAASGAGGPPPVGGERRPAASPDRLAAPLLGGREAIAAQPTGASPTTTHQPGAPAADPSRDRATAPVSATHGVAHGQIEPAAAAADGRSARSGAGSPRPMGPAAGPHNQRGEAGGVRDGATPASDPDLGTRRVAPARWDDTDAWHDAARAYADLHEQITSRPAPMIRPGGSVSRAIVAALGTLGERYRRRLELLTAAARGEPSTPAAHEAIRLAREVWIPRDDAKGLDGAGKAVSALASDAPSVTVAAVDRSVAAGVPLGPPPERRAPTRPAATNGLPTADSLARAIARRGMTAGEVIDAHD